MLEKITKIQLSQLISYCTIVVVLLSTFLEVSKIKVNPWTWLAKTIGRAINGEVLEKVDQLEKRLDKHIITDDERNADLHRARILQFNTELLRQNKHTEEDFNEILYNIDCYEKYCMAHPEYQNNRAVHAIKNIERIYDECMKNNEFLSYLHS